MISEFPTPIFGDGAMNLSFLDEFAYDGSFIIPSSSTIPLDNILAGLTLDATLPRPISFFDTNNNFIVRPIDSRLDFKVTIEGVYDSDRVNKQGLDLKFVNRENSVNSIAIDEGGGAYTLTLYTFLALDSDGAFASSPTNVTITTSDSQFTITRMKFVILQRPEIFA